jgi:hypothetical protein
VKSRRVALLVIPFLLLAVLGIAPSQVQASSPNSLYVVAMHFPPGEHVPPFSVRPPSNGLGISTGLLTLSPLETGAMGYAYGTSNYFNTCFYQEGFTPYGCLWTTYFPSSVDTLNNNYVSCSPYYDTTYSMASAKLVLPSAASLTVTIWSDDGMAVFYHGAGQGWRTVFAPSESWYQRGATQNVAGIILTPGTYYFRVAWFNSCGPGVQILYLQGLPSGATITSVPIPI